MKRVLALDLGDVWVGSALSDLMKLTCKPHQTVKLEELDSFITRTCQEYPIETIVVGLPVTSRGTESAQTKKVRALMDHLKESFPDVAWKFEDERMTSSWAVDHQRDIQKKRRSKETKLQEHSLAAAFILQTYLDRFRSF